MRKKVELSHGSGGKETREIIENIFIKNFGNSVNGAMEDCAVLGLPTNKISFTTDSYVVRPLFFPGGDIGKLAVCGTVNDLLTSGAKPLYISASFIIETGAELDIVSSIAQSMKKAADEAKVDIVTGDTKVVEGDGGVFINTTGIGAIGIIGKAINAPVSFKNSRDNDMIIVTGGLGFHHATILSARMEIKNNIKSDVAPLCEIVENLLSENIPIHGMRDVTRGGIATVLNEAADFCGLKAIIDEGKIPVAEEVRGFADILGLDPLYMGNEGCMMLFVPKENVDNAVEVICSSKYGGNAAVIGELTIGKGVELITRIGGRRFIPMLSGEGLPRIC